jgi:hypothetical protein
MLPTCKSKMKTTAVRIAARGSKRDIATYQTIIKSPTCIVAQCEMRRLGCTWGEAARARSRLLRLVFPTRSLLEGRPRRQHAAASTTTPASLWPLSLSVPSHSSFSDSVLCKRLVFVFHHLSSVIHESPCLHHRQRRPTEGPYAIRRQPRPRALEVSLRFAHGISNMHTA